MNCSAQSSIELFEAMMVKTQTNKMNFFQVFGVVLSLSLICADSGIKIDEVSAYFPENKYITIDLLDWVNFDSFSR